MNPFGPVLAYDLLRMARRARFFAFRALYGLALLGVLYLVHDEYLGRRTQAHAAQLAAFGEAFGDGFLLIQFLLVLLLTPAYLGGAIAEEKVRGTVDYLLTTQLTGREILVGKYVARLAGVFLFLLAGLPVLSLALLFGGVSGTLLGAGFVATAVTVLSVGAVALWQSIHARRPRDAVFLTYLLFIIYYGFGLLLTLVPPTHNTWADQLWNAGNVFHGYVNFWDHFGRNYDAAAAAYLAGLVGQYVAFHLVVAVACLALAAPRLRAVCLAQAGAGAAAMPATPKTWRRPPVGAWGLWWKEMAVESGARPLGPIGRAMALALVAATVGPIGFFYHTEPAYTTYVGFNGQTYQSTHSPRMQKINEHVRNVGTVLACVALLAVALRAATALGVERDRQTLDGLLAAPVRCWDILLAKWWGSLASGRRLFLLLALLWGLGMVSGGLEPWAVVLLAVAGFTAAALFASLGLVFSSWTTATQRASLWTLTLAIVAILTCGRGFYALAYCQNDLTDRWWSRADPLTYTVWTGLAGLVLGAVALILWRIAVEHFEEHCGRVDGRERQVFGGQPRKGAAPLPLTKA